MQALEITGAGSHPDPPAGQLGDAIEGRELPLAHHPLLDGGDQRLGEGHLLAPGGGDRQVGGHQIPAPLGQIVQQLVLAHRDINDLELELLLGQVGLVQPALESLKLIDQDAVLGSLVEKEKPPLIDHQGPELFFLQDVFEITGLGQQLRLEIRRQQRERAESQQGPDPSPHHDLTTSLWGPVRTVGSVREGACAKSWGVAGSSADRRMPDGKRIVRGITHYTTQREGKSEGQSKTAGKPAVSSRSQRERARISKISFSAVQVNCRRAFRITPSGPRLSSLLLLASAVTCLASAS